MMRRRRLAISPAAATRTAALSASLAALLIAATAGAQAVQVTPLLAAHDVPVLLVLGDRLYGGLDGGGLLVWNVADPGDPQRWQAGAGLSGNTVTDLAWTGRHLWAATSGGGLTRIGDPATAPAFRQYTSNLGSLDLTCVTGAVIGQSERVYYGMKGQGIGVITDGIAGNVYNAAQDGLISDNVTALAMYQDDLIVATEAGVARFADNQFTSMLDGLSDPWIADVIVDRSGALLAGGRGGVFRWDDQGQAWISLGEVGVSVLDLADGDAGLYALAQNAGGGAVLAQRVGSTWSAIALPAVRCAAAASAADLWIAGRFTEPDMGSGAGLAYLGRREAGGTFRTWVLDASLVQNAEGAAFDAAGRAWIGSYTADAVSGYDGAAWSSIYALADADNDSSGLINYFSNILAMGGDAQGAVWIAQYTTGLVRHDPATGRSDPVTMANSGLSGGYILDIVAHPDGPVLFMNDVPWGEGQGYPERVDVLLDGEHWRNADNWLTLPVDQGALTSNNRIWSAVVQERDVVWFAAEDLGLIRWDINGDDLGPQDALTWTDQSDDTWRGPITEYVGSVNDPRKVKGLAVAPDGSIWAGGNGVVRFRYDAALDRVTVLETYGEKTSPYVAGLLSGSVNDLAVDRNGHAWVATVAGLNRIRSDADPVQVDVWTDLANYLANPNYGLLYSPSVISSLPGGTYRDLAVGPGGDRLLATSDMGAALLAVGTAGVQDGASLAGVFCYPNPFYPQQGAGTLAVTGGPLTQAQDGSVAIVVCDLQGEVLLQDPAASPGVGFWNGENRLGEAVASGMYLVKVTWGGATALLPVAVVR